MLSRVAEVPPDVLSLQTVEDVLHLENQAQTFPLLFNPHDLLLADNFPLSLQQLRQRKSEDPVKHSAQFDSALYLHA